MSFFAPIELHGPPKIAGTTFPNAAMESPVEGIPIDESRYKTMADGEVKLVGAERYRLRWTLGWTRYLTAEEFATLIAALEDKSGFEFQPRTFGEGEEDPSEEIPTYTVRCVSDLPSITRPLYDEYFAAPDIVLETVSLIEEI